MIRSLLIGFLHSCVYIAITVGFGAWLCGVL